MMSVARLFWTQAENGPGEDGEGKGEGVERNG